VAAKLFDSKALESTSNITPHSQGRMTFLKIWSWNQQA